MRPQRYHLHLGVGNLLEIAGAGSAVYGLARLAGLAYGLILLGGLLVIAAELIYDANTLRVPLPHRPRPIMRARQLPSRVERWKRERLVRQAVGRARRAAAVASPNEIRAGLLPLEDDE